MAVVRERERQLFPLNNIAAVVRFFRWQLEDNCEPNLALLSIVIGAVENSLTCGRCDAKPVEIRRDAAADLQSPAFPVVDLLTVESLYLKFHAQIKGSVDLSRLKTDGFASRELVKRVSDVIWGSLARNCYKDKAHLRSLYSFLTRNKLDCFGVACAVVAACQVLKFNDVHLALSEDHAWLTFGKDGQETAEVTWHGKGNEDKRGQPVPCGVGEKSWLYLNGHPVRLTRQMEVAALISGMNPSIGLNSDSLELGTLQQELLWLLHDLGHLERYPMALGTLGDLEAICPLPGRVSPCQLYREAIESSRVHYHNQHVYPYTFYGRYLYGNQRYKEAIAAWADATDVIRHYNYNREDEEVYKEFLEIANELIPCMIKLEGAAEAGVSSSSCILRDAECFAHLLRFYDGICQWEEGSSTPVLHIGWAKPLVNTISKFDAKVRSMVEICIDNAEGEAKDEGCDTRRSDTVCDSSRQPELKRVDVTTVTATEIEEDGKPAADHDAPSRRTAAVRKRNANNRRSTGSAVSSGPQSSELIKSLENQMNPNDAPHPNIAALSAACGENILNPEYLLGSGEPFTAPKSTTSSTTAPILVDTDVKLLDCRDLLSSRSNATPFPGMTMDSMLKAEIPDDLLQGHMILQGDSGNGGKNQEKADSTQKQLSPAISAKVALHSEKMKGLKELLLSEKLNTSAIQLQLTAQSQVQVVRRNKVFREYEFVGSGGAVAAAPGSRASKRTRKD